MEFVDASIRDSCSPMEVSKCMHLGLLCVQNQAIDRPTMSSVITMLESGTLTSDLASPGQPTFAAMKTPSETDTSSLDLKITTTASFTTLTGR